MIVSNTCSDVKRLFFALIHSPLVGPVTWEPVAAELRKRDMAAVIPPLSDSGTSSTAYWQQHALSAAQGLEQKAGGQKLILVGHSGAGPILPAIRQSLKNPIGAYLFVDAGLPVNGASRLQMMEAEDVEWAAEFRRFLESGGRFPLWSEEDLREILPDPGLRAALVAELQPRALDFFQEPIPVFPGWPDAPCAYLHFSPPYDRPASRARGLGWPVIHLDADHFHMLVDPPAVVDLMIKGIEGIETEGYGIWDKG